MIVFVIKGPEGKFLKGNGTASYLKWHKHPCNATFYKTRDGANKVVERLSKRSNRFNMSNPVKAELFEIELILHGTVNDIMEKEVLS